MRIAVVLLSQTFNIFGRQDLTWLWTWHGFILVIGSLALAGSYWLVPVIALTYVQNDHDRRLREYVGAYVVCPTLTSGLASLMVIEDGDDSLL